MTHHLPDTELQAEAVENAVEAARKYGVVTTITHDGQPVATIGPVDRPAIRPPLLPREGHVFGLAEPIKLRSGGTTQEVLREQRR